MAYEPRFKRRKIGTTRLVQTFVSGRKKKCNGPEVTHVRSYQSSEQSIGGDQNDQEGDQGQILAKNVQKGGDLPTAA